MARQPRSIEPGSIYHLISRFVDREWFIRVSDERTHYLKLLGHALEDSDWRLMAYAVMSNHIHLAAVAGKQQLGEWIRRVHSPFADTMNRAYDRIGNVFVRGPKALPVAQESTGHLIAYIHNNPVRAGVCSRAALTNWTSHLAYIGEAPVPPWLHVAEGMARMGMYDAPAFDAWVNDPSRAESDAMFDEDHRAEELRAARNLEHTAERRVKETVAEAIVSATADVLGIAVSQLRSTRRGTTEVVARKVVVECGRSEGLTGATIARALDVCQQRVSVLRHERLSAEIRAVCEEVSRRVQRADGSRSSGA